MYIIPYGFIYISNDKISDHKLSTTYQIEAIIVDTQISVPIIPITIKKEELDKLLPNNILESRSLYDIIDHEIEKGSKNIEIDKRIEDIHLNKYYNEHYELFRFELSNYLNLYQNIKNKIIKILETKDINKVYEIKKLLFKITSDTLYNNFLELIKENDKSDNETINLTHGGHLSQSNKLTHGGHLENKIVNIMTEKLDLTNYNIKNNRELCVNLNNKDECNINLHCTWIKNKCLFNVEETKLIEFIARITDELINNELKSKEILNIDLYFVSDIVNYDDYTYREKQKIIKSDNLNINKILSEIFGKSNIPIIGRKKLIKNSQIINDENLTNPIEKISNLFYQKIINSNVLFRAYSNALYWITNSMSSISFRNLGYYSVLQTDLANIFKSYIYDWIVNDQNQKLLYENFKDIIKISLESFINDYKIKLFLQKEYYYLGLIDLFILNQYHNIPIVLLDQYDNPFIIIDSIIVYNIFNKKNTNNYDKKYLEKNIIKIKYICDKFSLNILPNALIVVYEL